jgi:hypothetical protein
MNKKFLSPLVLIALLLSAVPAYADTGHDHKGEDYSGKGR